MKATLNSMIHLAMLAATLGFPGMAGAATYHPAKLAGLESTVAADAAAGNKPVVIFDLDDTLINTRDRTRRIMKDFAAQADVQTSNPLDADVLAHLEASDVQYNLSDTFKNAGIDDPALLQKASDFWAAHFFTNEYAATDRPNPGAVAYVNTLHDLGAQIVYLTGRDTPRMGDGTKQNLQDLGFPLDDSATLMMKPDKSINDLQFKKDSFDAIATQGQVDGVFENEPANINAMHTRFPDAVAIFLDTIHSSAPDVVGDGITFERNFHAPAGCNVARNQNTTPAQQQSVASSGTHSSGFAH